VITVIQRVRSASVVVDGHTVGSIGTGLLLLVGVEQGDQTADADTTATKIAKLRCFAGRTPMDRSVLDLKAACLVVSQFTLCAELAQGNRPSFVAAEDPEVANALYQRVAQQLRDQGIEVATGRFGAKMGVSLENDGPVTFVMQVRNGKVQSRSN
jgi:D-tyrosyl-tRNA(Tyr) deacylase